MGYAPILRLAETVKVNRYIVEGLSLDFGIFEMAFNRQGTGDFLCTSLRFGDRGKIFFQTDSVVKTWY